MDDTLFCRPPRGNTPAHSASRHKRSAGYRDKFWENGRTLKIGFVDDYLDETHRQAIVDAILQWQPHIGLELVFIDGREGQPGHGQGDIRITTDSEMNYSLIGTDARSNDPWTPTMVLGIRPSHPRFTATVMHEFGHALGLEHEHQHPDADIPWDVDKVYAHYTAKGIDRTEVDEQVMNRLPRNGMRTTAYDKTSIMHYPVPNELTIGDWEVGHNLALSELDKALVRSMYPKN